MPEQDVEIEVKESELEPKPKESPPKSEGDKKDEGPPPGSERWKEIYWQAQEGKRVIEEVKQLREELKNNQTLITQMKEWNQTLSEGFKGISDAVAEPRRGDEIKDVEGKISELKNLKKGAREKGDFDAEDKYDEELAELRFKLRELKTEKPPKKEESSKGSLKEPGEGGPSSVFSSEELSMYEGWIEENQWFNRNPGLRGLAIKTEKEIWKDPNYEYATVEEVLNEVKVRMEPAIKSRYKGSDAVEFKSKGADNVTPVKLNSTEIELAKGMGISPEDFAKQKLIIQRARSPK